jgi:hypothetical protein
MSRPLLTKTPPVQPSGSTLFLVDNSAFEPKAGFAPLPLRFFALGLALPNTSNSRTAVVSIDTGIFNGRLTNREAFPQRTKKRAGNAVKRFIAS